MAGELFLRNFVRRSDRDREASRSVDLPEGTVERQIRARLRHLRERRHEPRLAKR